MALLEFLAAAAGASIVAAGLLALDDGFLAWAHALPQLVQVIDRPDGFTKSVHTFLAGGCGAGVFVQIQLRLVGVVFGEVDDELHSRVQHLRGFLVARCSPVV